MCVITLMALMSMLMYSMMLMILPMHPLSIGMMILLLALLTCSVIATTSPWYAYMLFFIFIGGMLVMFAYIASLSPNMTFSANNQLLPMMTIMLMIIFSIDLKPNFNSQINQTIKMEFMNLHNSLNFLYTQTDTMLIMLGCILLFTMIATVSLCKPKKGSLRPFL